MTPPGPSSPPAGAALPVTSWRPPATSPASSPPPPPADQQSARTPVTTTANDAHTCPGCSHTTRQAPRRVRKGLPTSRLGKDTRRPSSSPQRTSRGPRGVLPGARQGHTPTKRDPKMEIGVQVCRALPRPPLCVRCPLDRGAVGCRRFGWVALGFLFGTREKSEEPAGRAVARGDALHLCCFRVNLSLSRPIAPTGSCPEGAIHT